MSIYVYTFGVIKLITNNILFTSEFRYEYVSIKDHVVIPASGIGNAVSITHNLGYIPFFRLFVKYPDRSFYEQVVQTPVDQGGYTNYQVGIVNLNTSSISIDYFNNTGGADPAITVYYRIYAEPQS